MLAYFFFIEQLLVLFVPVTAYLCMCVLGSRTSFWKENILDVIYRHCVVAELTEHE